MVRRFALQSLVALAVLLGLALLDLGPRSRAGFVPAWKPEAVAAMDGAGLSEPVPGEKQVWPPPPGRDGPPLWIALIGDRGSDLRGAGSGSSTVSSANPAGLTPRDLPSPALVTRLQTPPVGSSRSSCPVGVFEPPRGG